MSESQLFKSIYKDYNLYSGFAASIIGQNNIFVEDIVSDCIMTIVNGLNNGKLNLCDISNNNNINTVFFKLMIRNRSIDWLRLKKNATKLDIDSISIKETLPTDYDILINKSMECIKEKLRTFEKESASNRHHVNVYNLYYDKRIKIQPLSKATTISRSKLTNSKKIIENYISDNLESWLKEEKRK